MSMNVRWDSVIEALAAKGWSARVVGAIARPLTQATLTVGGAERAVPVPPHDAGYAPLPDDAASTTLPTSSPETRALLTG